MKAFKVWAELAKDNLRTRRKAAGTLEQHPVAPLTSLIGDEKSFQPYIEKILIRREQMETMDELIKDIVTNKPLPSAIQDLRPYVDSDAIIRLSTRLERAEGLPLSRKAPPLLLANSELARKWTEAIHTDTLEHMGGKNTLIRECQENFWQIGYNETAKSVLKHCVHCQRRNKQKPVETPMPPLHLTRIPADPKAGKAFTFCGIDFFVPRCCERFEV